VSRLSEALHRQLGLTDEEHDRIVALLGREPSRPELAMYSLMWSEHCSYKSSKVHLRRLPTEGPRVLQGPGENAGVVDVGGGVAAVFKIESHNHPSFVEPFQGAATGVGGIIRDVLAMGARPAASLDSLRFGDLADPLARRLLEGVVAGIGHYGNCVGVATVGGEVAFDPCYQGNPLVNALTVGFMPAGRPRLSGRDARAGDLAVLMGAKTGRDGIGGASVLASASFEQGDEAKRPNVQVGDPFQEKLLIEACLELVGRGLLRGLQDLGAAGVSCAVAEVAARAGKGMAVDLDAVPLREPSMEAWEVLVSESQERMLALVEPARLPEVLEVCARWGVLAGVLGSIEEGGRLVVRFRGEVVADVPARSLADEGPTYERPLTSPPPPVGDPGVPLDADPAAVVLALAADPTSASKRWLWEQYDRFVGHATVAGPGSDAAVLLVPGGGGRAVALATDGNGRHAALDPAAGAALAVAEAARNVACTGATPVAVTNCLNFASPERPEVMGAFAAAVDGMAAACRALGLPVTGGNVSFYNESSGRPVHPTPVVGVLGVLEDATAAVGAGFPQAGLDVWLLGETRAELGGSAWQRLATGRLAGRPPALDLAAELALQRLLVALAGRRLLASAHDCSDGGLALALVEATLAGEVGATVELPGGLAPAATGWSSPGCSTCRCRACATPTRAPCRAPSASAPEPRRSAQAAALAVGPDVGRHHVDRALVRVRVGAGDQYHVAVVGPAHGDALGRQEPRQQRRRAHVVVDQRPAQAVAAGVGQRAVQQVAVEQHHRAGGHLHGHCVVVAVGEVEGLHLAVEAGVVVVTVGVEHPRPVRAGEHPQAAVLHGGIVQGDPRGGQRPVPGGDEQLVLVPCLPRLALRLDEQHRLHGLEVGADQPGQGVDDHRVGQRPAHALRQLVREVDAQVAAHHDLVGLAVGGRLRALHRAELAAADAHRLLAQRRHLAGGQRAGQHHVAVSGESLLDHGGSVHAAGAG
jgi:phosphoribosylformylglycinamidine synthase